MKLRNTTTIALAVLLALFTGLSHWLAYEATRDALQASVDKREADKVEAIGRFLTVCCTTALIICGSPHA